VRRAAVLALGLLPALLAWGLFRLERDQPLWLRPALPPAPRRAPAEWPRLVLAFHYPWYGTPTGPSGRWRHWNHARVALPEERILGFHDPRWEVAPGRLDLGTAHYPARGPYDSRDPALIREQLQLAREAGLDGFVVSWWGRESEEAVAFRALLEAARDSGLRLTAYYEAAWLWPRGVAGVAADLETLLARHGGHPAFLRAGGVPVVLVYGAHRLRPAAWDAIRRRLHARGHRVLLVGDAARPGWLERFEGLHLYSPIPLLARGQDLARVYRERADAARTAGIPFLPAVAPGFDDRVIREPATVVDRLEGATYDATWRAALAADAAGILVASWNEWHEGSEIEPSREHGRRYLDATRRWAERFRAGGG